MNTSARPDPLELSDTQLLQALQHMPAPALSLQPVPDAGIRLIRLDEINEQQHQAYRQALANVYASLDPGMQASLLYLLDGRPDKVALYFGIATHSPDADLHEALINLRGALEGQLPGINFGKELALDESANLLQCWQKNPHQGLMLGAPTVPAEERQNEESFQSLDRIVHALQSGSGINSHSASRWQIVVLARPLGRKAIETLLDEAYRLSSLLASQVRTSLQASENTNRQKSLSVGLSEATGTTHSTSRTRGRNEGGSETKSWGESRSTNSSSKSDGTNRGESQTKTTGTNISVSKTEGDSHTHTQSETAQFSTSTGGSLGWTREIADKRAQHLMDFIDEELVTRLQRGLSKGLFQSTVFLTADNRSTYERLKNALRATFQGEGTTLSPLTIHDLPPNARGLPVQLPRCADGGANRQQWLFHSLTITPEGRLGSLLTADELATIASLPERELPGIRRRKTVGFVVDLPEPSAGGALDLGEVIDRGRRYPNNRILIDRADLNKHCFVTGVTGAGKTNTCLNLLIESRLPFLVIEPAKTEYRKLVEYGAPIDYYRPNGERFQSLRINPFALIRRGQNLKSHIGFMNNVIAAVFPLEASMPMMIEAAMIAAYEQRGWDVDANEFLADGDPFDPASRAWPTLSDMVAQLDRLIPTYGLGKEFEEKYRGSLVSRLRRLTDGTLGQVLDVPQSLDFLALLRRRVVIELEELQSGEEKALMMALILGALNEAIREINHSEPDFRHLTLVEEAHRLLSRPEPGDKAAAMAVESFADMLAEVRRFGAGLIIADQIPAKLIPDVIKNTHTKIVHRIFAEDDRRAMGEAMMMSEEQRAFLPNLATGEAIVFCGGWHGPVHAAIRLTNPPGAQQAAFDLDRCAVQQLWRERDRYYPQFCRLGWLSGEDDDPRRFAEFVTETRRAQRSMLQLLASENVVGKQAKGFAFIHLRQWYEKWLALANAAATATQAPAERLAAAWCALLLDANPRPYQQQTAVPPLAATEEDRELLAKGSQQWLALVADAKDYVAFDTLLKERRKGARGADFDALCILLGNFKSL